MKKLLASAALVASLLLAGTTLTPATFADYPKPSLYPTSWELKFTNSVPKRIVVQVPGKAEPQAYWYITYTVTNPTDKEVTFLPVLEMLASDGSVTRSDNAIPGRVYDVIRTREANRSLLTQAQIGGPLKIGEDQAKEGIAVWPETPGRMGAFSIFVQGLSGEAAKTKGPDGKEVTLRKTLQLNYLIRGDEVYKGEDQVNENPSEWVMR